MNTAADNQEPKVIPVIDCEVIETGSSVDKKNIYAQVPHRAAVALDAIADMVGHVSPERADDIRQKARMARTLGHGVETVQETGSAFLGTVKKALDKAGLPITMVNRRPDIQEVVARRKNVVGGGGSAGVKK